MSPRRFPTNHCSVLRWGLTQQGPAGEVPAFRVAGMLLCLAGLLLTGCGESSVPNAATPVVEAALVVDEAPAVEEIDARTRAFMAALAAREALPGKVIYDARCAACHNGAVAKAPHRLMVELMTPEAIAATLNTGLMTEQGAVLTPQERVEVAEYLARGWPRPRGRRAIT